MGRYRVLYLVRWVPYPLNSGTRKRQFQLLSAYSQMADVVLVCYYNDEVELAALSVLAPYCTGIHPVSFRGRHGDFGRSRFLQRWGQLRHVAPSRPFLANHCFSREMKQLVERTAASCDLVHVGRLHMTPHVQTLLDRRPPGLRFVLDLDDIETVLRRRELQESPPRSLPRRVFSHLDLCRLRRYQRRSLRSYDRVLVCSEADRQQLDGHASVRIIPNGADLPADPLPDRSDGRTLLCLATYGHWPNVDGLRFFVTEVFPLIQEEIEGARLLVVGRDTPREVQAFHDGQAIFVEGTVPSVEECYLRATVAVVPLRIGAGTRLRILEAFALGRPVVSTTVGCEGLEVVDGRHLLIADEPRALADACIDLLRDPGLRERLVRAGRELVARHYTWESIHQRVLAVAREVLGECWNGPGLENPLQSPAGAA